MTIKTYRAEVALTLATELGEGPVWDERRQELFLVDLTGRAVHGFVPGNGAHRSFGLDRTVGCVVLQDDGRLLMACEDAFFSAEPDGEGLVQFGAFSTNDPQLRFNDGKVDPWGRLVVGTMEWAEERPAGCLLMLVSDGTVTTLLEGALISNGLAWGRDGRTLYYIDTPLHRVDAFDVEPDSGALSNRRVVAKVEGGGPDGMAIDDDGNLWVAVWGGRRVEVIEPVTGRQVAVVHLPTTNVSSVAFGGPSLDQLYITTARRGLNPATLSAEPHAGDIFVVEPGVTGPPANRFATS
jgi:sugar lactone lactonase YvrE